MPKKRIVSGIQPTGMFTLGNYLGAVKQWRELQEEYESLYFIADLHALTVRQDPEAFREKVLSCAALLLACGLDPHKSTIFIQSAVVQHTQLAWVLSCCTSYGELSRMTQFKDKSMKRPDNINAGLFTYPVLMAADILLYQADYVPIGADQKQHLELTRNIAARFHQLYGETFTIPEPFIPKQGARIMSLSHPDKKMSKSDLNPGGYISLLDPPETILRKCKRAVTDSENAVCFREGKDGINNLMTIYAACTGKSYPEIEAEFAGRGYGDFKKAVGEAVVEELLPIQQRYESWQKKPDELMEICRMGAQKAEKLAKPMLQKAYRAIGIEEDEKG